MKLISYEFDALQAERAIQFALGIEGNRKDPIQEQRFYDPTNPYFRHAKVRNFILERAGEVCGTISAFSDQQSASEIGLIGLFQCIQDETVAQQLLAAATQWLTQEGKQKIIGPVDLSVWNRFRFKVLGFDRAPHTGEPLNPEYYPKYWENYGFVRDRAWRSWDLTRDEFSKLTEFIKSRFGKVAKGWQVERVFSISPEMGALFYQLVVESFKENYLITEINRAEFESIYGYLIELLPVLHLYFLRSPEGHASGVGLRHPDFLNPLGLENTNILNMFGILKNCRGHGVAGQFLSQVFEDALGDGHEKYLGYLVKEGLSVFSHAGPHTREYVTYKMEV